MSVFGPAVAPIAEVIEGAIEEITEMLSQTLEYALRAMVYLAQRGEGLSSSEEIAGVTRVPRPYLSKVMKALGDAGLVDARRGLGGGFALARPAERILLLDVVTAVDPIRRIRHCPLDLASHGARLCPLHSRLDDALASIERAFAETTLAEILATPTTSRPLCPFPAAPSKPGKAGRARATR